MAVRVLKVGKPRADRTYRGTCGSCRCVIECVEADLKHDNDPREPSGFIGCPTPRCGGTIYPTIVPDGGG